MSAFEPRRAAPGAPARWLREAGALLLRRPLAWAACGAAVALGPALLGRALESGAVAPVPGTLLVVLCTDAWLVLACGLGVHVAALADEGEGAGELGPRLGDAARSLAAPVGLSLLLWGLVYAALVAVGAGAWPWLLELVRGAEIAPGQRAAAWLGALNIALAPIGGWFAAPLLAHANAPLPVAMELASKGVRLNARALWPLALAAAALWLVTVLWAIPALAPFGLGAALGLCLVPLSALLYVSYRDVFLGRGHNAPVRASAARSAEPAIQMRCGAPSIRRAAGRVVRHGTRATNR